MAIRKKVFPSSAWNRESTQFFSRPVPAKSRQPYSTPSRSQQAIGISLDFVLFLSCHWAAASPGKLFKMQILSPYPRLRESETLISNLFQQVLQVIVRVQTEKALLWAMVGRSGSLVLLGMTPRAMSAPPHFSGPCYRLKYVFQNSSVGVLTSKYNCIWR